MNIQIKKTIARELLILFVSSLICLLAYCIGNQRDIARDKKSELLKQQINQKDLDIDNYILKFRKTPEIDSIYKLQMDFYTCYMNIRVEFYGNQENQVLGNYYFWETVRKSIIDSTFHVLFANDDLLEHIVNINHTAKNSDYRYELLRLLRRMHKVNAPPEELNWAENVNYVRNEFKNFATTNNYERYVNKLDWQDYQKIRDEKVNLESEVLKLVDIDYTDKYFLYSLNFCLTVLFLLRYGIYIILWCIKILKVKSE